MSYLSKWYENSKVQETAKKLNIELNLNDNRVVLTNGKKYKAVIEINIEKKDKSQKQLERELRKLSFFRKSKDIYLKVNII
jgi:preprotein translocase subunit SecB